MTGPVKGRTYPFTSQFGTRNATVQLDPWATNPLADDARQSVPLLFNAALASNGEPPAMFESGDLPPFTASGVDPQHLLLVPWKVRHAMAGEPQPARALDMVERFGNDPDAGVGDPITGGQAAYLGRFRDWLAGKWTNPNFTGPDTAAAAEADDALASALLAAGPIGRAQAKAAAAAANNPLNYRSGARRLYAQTGDQ